MPAVKDRRPARPSRRALLGGFAALGSGLVRGGAVASSLAACAREDLGRDGWERCGPLLPLRADRPLVRLEGFPFAPGFEGDPWGPEAIPFHGAGSDAGEGASSQPEPELEVEVVVVGGGLSGLTSAWLLREHAPLVLELRERFGGVSQGLRFDDLCLSQGGAYFIAPDPGSELERLYHELELERAWRPSPSADDPVELEGSLRRGLWRGQGLAPEEARAFLRYGELVRSFAEERYPDIPLRGEDDDWIRALDRRTLKEDLEQRLGGAAPRLLACALQAYCYSSFGSGWETISAAAGWNFLAAEELGRLVCPGGNAWVADTLWRRLARHARSLAAERLRAQARVVRLRVERDGRVRVSWREGNGPLRSLLARAAVLACNKHVCRRILPDLAAEDPERDAALAEVRTQAYLVANVLLERPLQLEAYDLFLLGDGALELRSEEPASGRKPLDLVHAGYASPLARRGGFTLYWPMPSARSRVELLAPDAFEVHARRLAPELERVLALLSVPREAVREVRLTRWGHALPLARPGFLAEGLPERLREPWKERVWFVHQDTWALPALETSMLEALAIAPRVAASL